MQKEVIKEFQNLVWDHYLHSGRVLPWRSTTNPYHILVSEVMLQQTQVDRVIPKYKAFLKIFPNVKVLAKAPQSRVLKAWQGLGYNRRALYLKRAAEVIAREGRFPRHAHELEKLPGIGPYTARAIATFAFGFPEVFIETNIRSAFIHFFFPKARTVDDAKLLPIIKWTLPKKNYAEWYQALMDYGAHLKRIHTNPSRRSAHYVRQSVFEGSHRQIRGSILRVVEKNETITLGGLKARFFAVSHTIPDSMGVIIETPHGSIVHTGDLRVDNDAGVPTEAEENEWSLFKNMNVLALLTDSTNVEKAGFSISERVVYQNIEEIIKNTKGRLVIGTFSSQLERIIKMIEIAERYNKKVIVEGRSMKTNVEIAIFLKLLQAKEGTIVPMEDIDSYPPDRIVVIATGAQADEFAALARMGAKNHKYLKINKTDTVLLSSSIIPGNERAVQKLKDNLSRQGAKIIHYRIAEVHASGHANHDEMMWIHSKVNPRFFIPIHGYHQFLKVHAQIAYDRGMKEQNVIIPDDGSIIEITDNGEKIKVLKEKAPSGLVLVDGFSIGDMQEVVIRDRQMLAKDGMFVIIASINPKTGKLRKSPDIISRGFVYLRESQDLLNQTRLIIKKTVEDTTRGMNPLDLDFTKTALVDNVGRFLFQKTNKRPIVIPVLIGV